MKDWVCLRLSPRAALLVIPGLILASCTSGFAVLVPLLVTGAAIGLVHLVQGMS